MPEIVIDKDLRAKLKQTQEIVDQIRQSMQSRAKVEPSSNPWDIDKEKQFKINEMTTRLKKKHFNTHTSKEEEKVIFKVKSLRPVRAAANFIDTREIKDK